MILIENVVWLMDIGLKIKNARINANLTQEQVAEAIGVSRQTISNWENEKTYPDIISVVKMSDLYNISLDHLLKEEKTMPGYLDYLEKSTNTVKSNDRKAKITFISVYLAIWAFAIIVFWFFTSGSDAMGYSLMFIWILLPVSTFILSVIIGRNDYWGNQKWASAVVFGIMYMLAEYATFNAANMAAFNKFNMPRFGMIVGGAVISVIGIAIGCALRRMKKS
ncbi:MAG: helix-turn-helix domain-containing protein [Clostridiales bacterium]|nr:helix-turn-helix domain-containing protein [Clostridiales bacterium]